MGQLYLFRLGKNPELSIAEVVSLLRMGSAGFSIRHYSEEIMLLELERRPPLLERLGGTLKVAEVIDTFDGGIGDIDTAKYFPDARQSVVFGVSAYGDNAGQNSQAVSGMVKDKLKSERVRTSHIHSPLELEHGKIARKKISEIIAFENDGRIYLARTIFVHDPFEFRKRDMKKPHQRHELAIPPRLARIMINLAGKRSGVLLDPFCGVGSILQEAGLMGYQLKGLDRNSNRIPECRGNLEWLKKEYKIGLSHRVICGDALRMGQYVEPGTVDLIVTEPYLGPSLRKTPHSAKAFKIISILKPMYEEALKGMFQALKKGGRVCIVSPRFHSKERPTRLGMENLAENAGFSVIDPLKGTSIGHERPLLDFTERHRLIREIHVFGKD
ncbi:MAG: hypothetical protein HY518_03840 [Candidatus Aenigmarchaeota archaeon]|nr:hypothetical protein [Candidatus Aenigmarchaeota archaeon]